MRPPGIRLLLGVLACLGLSASGVHAATFTVTKLADTNDGVCDADCSLREAIGAANLAAGPDEVEVPAGSYVLGLGELPVGDDLTLRGAGHVETVVDANGAGRALSIQTGVTALLDALAVVDGSVAGNGGGILNQGALTLTHARVFGNSATGNGGGLFSDSASELVVTDSLVLGNSAGAGGGIYTDGSAGVTLRRLEVKGNLAGGGDGGGVHLSVFDGPLTFTDCLISANRAPLGSGGGASLASSGDPLVIERLTVAANEALHGGGIFSVDTELADSTIRDNVATDAGGGLHVNLLTLTNSTVSGNTAARGGGLGERGLFSVQWQLFHTTVADNTSTATAGGGLFAADADFGRILASRNSVIAGNSPDNCNLMSSILLDTLSSGSVTDDATCNLADPSDQVVADARLAPLASNGGPTLTHALLPDSPAVDAALAADCPDLDQRGLLRPVDGNRDGSIACDAGAFELLAFGIPALPAHGRGLLGAALGLGGALWLRRRARGRNPGGR